MIGRLRRVVVRSPEIAFQNQEKIDAEWKALSYSGPPDFEKARREHRMLVNLLEESGVEILMLDGKPELSIDSIYAHDTVLIADDGAIVLRMGKPGRRSEEEAISQALEEWSIPIIGRLTERARAEGGDCIWLDQETLLIGRGYRTNSAGIDEIRRLLEPRGVNVVAVKLPHASGPEHVLHLGTFMSVLDRDLVVAHKALMTVSLIERLSECGVEIIDVDEAEQRGQGSNILAVAPRDLLMVSGNPVVRKRLIEAGCRIREFDGEEIAVKGSGGPTCLTRPIWRDPV